MRNKPDIDFNQLQTIGKRIRALREDDRHKNANKQSQEEFADALGVSRDSVSNWELGNTPPLLTHILKICDLYGVDVDYLLGRVDCSTHDLQFIHDQTGLSEEAIIKITAIKDDPLAIILSNLITDREFIYVLRSIDTLSKANFDSAFVDSVRAYYVSRFDNTDVNLPYMDDPDAIRAVYEHQPTRHFERIVDRLTTPQNITTNKDNGGE